MTKWADFVITCATYTSDGSKIATVGVRPDLGATLGVQQIWHREQVVRSFNEGKSFVTAIQNEAEKWTKGAQVFTYAKGEEVFIKTEANNTAADNLGKLPPCA